MASRPDLRRALEHGRSVLESAAGHRLASHAAAIAYRLLVSLVPLVLLGVALLGALGLEDLWEEDISPRLAERLSGPVFSAIDFAVEEIFATSSTGLIVFAVLLLLWEISRAVREVSRSLNDVHEVEESRSFWRLALLTGALAVAVVLCLVGAFLLVSLLPRVHGLLVLAAWPGALVLMGLAVHALLRWAPAEHPSPAWASAGSVAIVVTWTVASVAFAWWAGSVATYKNAVGNLTVFLLLTAYVYVVSAAFLVGAELDEYARTTGGRASGGRRGASRAGGRG